MAMERSVDSTWKSIADSHVVRKEIDVPIVYARYDDRRETLIIKTPWTYKNGNSVFVFINGISPERIFYDFARMINRAGYVDLDKNTEYFAHVLVYKRPSNRKEYPFTLSVDYNESSLMITAFQKSLLRKDGQITLDRF